MTKTVTYRHWKPVCIYLASVFFIMLPHQLKAQAPDGTNGAKQETTALKRDPFWPVGYVPERVKKAIATQGKPTAVRPTVANDWSRAMKKIAINGVSSRASNEFFAVINGQVKSVGDTVTVNHDGMVYTWAVESIKPPGSVKLRRVSAR